MVMLWSMNTNYVNKLMSIVLCQKCIKQPVGNNLIAISFFCSGTYNRLAK